MAAHFYLPLIYAESADLIKIECLCSKYFHSRALEQFAAKFFFAAQLALCSCASVGSPASTQPCLPSE
jgi:hypothetical protein